MTSRAVIPALMALVGLLTGCATPPLQTDNRDFPSGTIMTLDVPVTIEPGSAGTMVRGGSIGDQYRYEASCRLEVRTVAKSPTTISPDSFTVKGVTRDLDPLTGTPFGGMRTSFNSLGEGGGLIYYNTYIYLSSESQPDVLRLKCRHLQETDWGPRYLTYEEITTVLGDKMTVHRPASLDAS